MLKPLLVALLTTGLVLPPSLAWGQDDARTPGRRPAGAEACPTLRNLDPANWAGDIGFDAGPLERLETWEREIRGETSVVEVPGDATVVLRAFAGSAETQIVSTDSVAMVWREADGVWRFHKVDWAREAIPPPPPSPGDPAPASPFDPRTVTIGVLAAESAQALETLLADPCLMLEPATTGPALQVRRGVPVPPPCSSGTGGTVQLTREGRTRTWSLFCQRLLSGELLSLALYPRAGAPGETVGARPLATGAFPDLDAARARAALALSSNDAAEAWADETSDASALRFRHRATGIVCRVPNDPVIGLSASPYGDVCRWGAGPDGQRLALERSDSASGLAFRMTEEAPEAIKAVWDEQDRRPAPRRARVGGRPVLSMAFIDGPLADARDERYVLIHGAQDGEWQVVLKTQGATDDRAAVDQLHTQTWTRLMADRGEQP
jgi:hypothetical protein